MALRHLTCFLVVAEELHFARAAEQLHIEQSPLSRATKERDEAQLQQSNIGERYCNRTAPP